MARIHPEHYEQEEQHQNSENNQDCEQCKQEKAKCLEELALMKDRLQRVTADFDNFKKRLERERASLVDTIEADLIKELLPVIDNFDRAINEHKKEKHSPELDVWLEGFELIAKSLYKFLSEHDVQVMTNVTHFDPQFHEAIAQVAAPDKEHGTIIEVVKQGFMYKNNVLRPAQVVVAK